MKGLKERVKKGEIIAKQAIKMKLEELASKPESPLSYFWSRSRTFAWLKNRAGRER